MKRNLAAVGAAASILAQEAENMKKYLVTEKQLDELKKMLDGGLFVNHRDERDLKFLLEDIEAKELRTIEVYDTSDKLERLEFTLPERER